jgi:hypothetical protein
MRTYRNPMMDRPITDLMGFDHVVAVMPDGRVIDTDEGFNHLDVHAPEVVIDYDGPFAEAQISKEHDDAMVENLREQGWEVLSGYSGQYQYAGPIMHASEFIGGGLEERIREEPGYWVALTVDIHPSEDDPEHEENGGSGESDYVGWIVARKIGSEDEIDARTGWIAEDLATWHFDPECTRRPMRDEDAAMSDVQVFYKGDSEDAARLRLSTYWIECAHMNHVRMGGEDAVYLDAADKIVQDGEVYSIKPTYRTGRVRAFLKPKETSK